MLARSVRRVPTSRADLESAWQDLFNFFTEEKVKVIPLLFFLCVLSCGSIAAPATDKPSAWWGNSSHHQGKTVRPHTGRRNLSTHPERRRRATSP
jgi:hypothetical protein